MTPGANWYDWKFPVQKRKEDFFIFIYFLFSRRPRVKRRTSIQMVPSSGRNWGNRQNHQNKKTKQIERIMACRGCHLVAERRTTGESQRVRLALEGLFLLGLGRFRLVSVRGLG